jgi:hypothetical protein
MIRLRAPSPTTVIACIALFFALGGSGYMAFAHGDAHAAKKKAKKGPPGPPGANGINGTNGTNGTARAYARMDNPCATSSACSIDHAKGISGIRQTSTGGLYCVTATGIDPNTTAAVVSVDAGDTGANVGDAQAMPNSNGAACNSGEFEVQTTRGAGGNSTTVAFFIVIP